VVGALTTALIAASLLCADGSRADDSPPGSEVDEQHSSESRAERLRALGYLDYSAEIAPTYGSGSGVVLFDPARAQPGHNLIVSSMECVARLLDMGGEVLHVWRQADCGRWFSAEWLGDGDLVVNGRLRPPSSDRTTPPGRFTARIAPDGGVRWLRQMRSHHQIDFTPQREVLVMTEALVAADRFERTGLSVDAEVRIHENPLHWLDANGDPLDSLSLFDAVLAGGVDFDFASTSAMQETPAHLGVFHANSAYAMDQPHLIGADELHAADNVLVTSRNQDRVFVISRSRRSLLWQWGKRDLSRPHDGTWLGNGNILVFDNGVERQSSRVVEVDPALRTIVWQYPGADGEPFYSPARGSAQRLENGNTLIVASQAGMAFEVTPSGETVWRYLSPPAGASGRRPTLVDLRRYSAELRLPSAPPLHGQDAKRGGSP
jgi:hypothetical protein